jgi:acetylornithine/succinyldiaminopimelate/putrescine aminotransferase
MKSNQVLENGKLFGSRIMTLFDVVVMGKGMGGGMPVGLPQQRQ